MAATSAQNDTYIASAMVDEFIARSTQSSEQQQSTSASVSVVSTPPGLHVPSPTSQYPAIDYNRERYPFCVVWTPLPLITWILPFIGHMGICDSRGVIHDFAGPYYVSRDNMAFGNPVKFWYLYPDHVATELVVNGGGGGNEIQQQQSLTDAVRRYDKGIAQTTDHFKKTQFYNFFCNNCHSFVAHCIIAGEQLTKDAAIASGDQKDGGINNNKKVFKNKTWNMVTLTMYLFFFGRYVSWGRFLIAHIPFLIFVAIIAAIGWGASAVTKKVHALHHQQNNMQGKKQPTNNNVSNDPLVLGGTAASPAVSAPPHKVFDKGVWKRGATISVVAPTVVYLIITPLATAVLVWFLTFVAMVEWTSMKRHLKVALLHEDGEKYDEYPAPVAKTNLFIIFKCLACSFAVIPACYSAELFGLYMASYFMFWVVFTLMGQNKAEIVAADARKKVMSSFPAGTAVDEDAAPSPPISPITMSSLSPKERFLHQELSVIANKCNTDLFLSFALEYFGFCWIMGLSHGILVGQLGPAGQLIVLIVIVANWANDIVALLAGRTLKGKTRALYPRISPNKSLEGAVAGTIANGISASLLITFLHDPETMYFGQDVIPVWISFLVLGLFFGVVGVVGDLLQSLFKRSARIKDTGAFFPGHGGVLDRIDGLLLCYPVAYWMLWVLNRYATPSTFNTGI